MPHLNVELEPEVIAVAKESAARAGMLLRAWIARVILSAGTVEANRVGTSEGPLPVMKVKEPELRERRYEPAE